jgi:nitroreductase/NAD-dependent dihydropyrimidine dehydrogenase PreA subunit
MAIFTIDPQKCKRDGICVQVCPGRLIAQPTKKDFPTPVADAEEFCIDCGHCVAACPHGALTLETMPAADCPAIDRNALPDAEAVRKLLLTRRSVRCYLKKQIPRPVIQDLIDTARFAPTGSNKQPVHWSVIQNPADVRHLASLVIDFMKMMLPLATDEAAIRRYRRLIDIWDKGFDRILRDAPHLVIVSSPPDTSFPAADCATALAYLELYAFSKGLGTCWAGYFTAAANVHQPIMDRIALPAGYQSQGALMLGYPQFRYARIPKRREAQINWR